MKEKNFHLNLEDPFFPSCYKQSLQYNKSQKVSNFNLILSKALVSCGIDNSKMSTHSFRRGGAQHRVLFGKFKWSLDVVSAWASWSGNSDVLQCYLISKMNDTQTRVAMYALKTQIHDKSVEAMHNTHINYLIDVKNTLQEIKLDINTKKKSTVPIQTILYPRRVASDVPIQKHLNANAEDPNIQFNEQIFIWPKFTAVEAVVKFWMIGIPERNIPPLKQWPTSRRNGKLRSKYKQQSDIGCTYEFYKSENNEDAFWIKYKLLTIKDARIAAALEIGQNEKIVKLS